MRDLERRLDELLLAQATCGLSAAEAAELRGLLEAHPRTDADKYELGAAALLLASLDLSEPLPPTLRNKLDVVGAEWFARARRH